MHANAHDMADLALRGRGWPSHNRAEQHALLCRPAFARAFWLIWDCFALSTCPSYYASWLVHLQTIMTVTIDFGSTAGGSMVLTQESLIMSL